MEASGERERLSELEGEVRKLRRIVPMLAAGFILLLVWQFVPGPATIEARRFVATDQDGVARAEMTVDVENRPMLRLNDRRGKARAMLLLNPDRGGSLRFSDTTGHHRLQVMLREDGNPQIWLGNEGGRTRTYIGITPGFQVNDEDLRPIWVAPPQ